MRLAVVGTPVAHSLSPIIHTAAFDVCGIEGSYTAIDCDADGFMDVVDALRSDELDGCNVTMPHKRLAHAVVDKLEPRAARTGAVNTIVVAGSELVGHNTDIVGIIRAASDAGLPDGPVLVLGAGGAAAAALVAFEGRPLHVSARRVGAAAAVIDRVGVGATVTDFGVPVRGALIVNATPIGMHGEHLPDDLIDVASGLFEMPYASGVTPATLAMRQLGRPVAVGVDMLVAQAIESFRLWTGCAPPAGPILEALSARPSP